MIALHRMTHSAAQRHSARAVAPARRAGLSVAAALCLAALLSGTSGGVTLEADQARIKTAGALQRGDWNLWSNGELGDYVHVAHPGTCRIRVLAYGAPAAGVWPLMGFAVDGVILQTVTVGDPEPRDYKAEFSAAAGDYRITVIFLNDAKTATEDRNLYLTQLSVSSTGTGPNPTLADETRWRTNWGTRKMKLEQETLERAAKAIEQNRKDTAVVRVVDAADRPVPGVTVRVEQERQDFLFGANIFMFDRFGTPQENETYKARFRDLLNYATTGFYWRSYEPTQGKPDYAYTDKVAAWCAENHIRLKGHPLLWDFEASHPVWAHGQPSVDVQRQRVQDIVRRYAGKIGAWEVVNEPSHATGLTVDEPYRWARAADSNALLIINDYYVMADGCPTFFELLRGAVQRGVPFDGIGIQAHEPQTMRFPLDQVWATLDRYATLGKELHITEFTPTTAGQPITGSPVTGVWDEAAQADYAVKFYTVCFAHPAVRAITWWDLSDANSWLEGGGLLRKDLSPKPAYVALQKLIRGQWMTRAGGQTDEHGTWSFRGFRGDYVVRVQRAGGAPVEQRFHLGRNEPHTFTVTLP